MNVIWRQGKCDRCGLIKYVRRWFGVATMCAECTKIADKESGE
jgi:hypothetical protein